MAGLTILDNPPNKSVGFWIERLLPEAAMGRKSKCKNKKCGAASLGLFLTWDGKYVALPVNNT
jgi:hypothetical protein